MGSPGIKGTVALSDGEDVIFCTILHGPINDKYLVTMTRQLMAQTCSSRFASTQYVTSEFLAEYFLDPSEL